MTSEQVTAAPELDSVSEFSEQIERVWWASVEPAIGHARDSARCWRVFINLVAGAGEVVDRHRVAQIDVQGTMPGNEALAAIESSLLHAGFRRSGEWQQGDGRGYVCWLDIAPLEV